MRVNQGQLQQEERPEQGPQGRNVPGIFEEQKGNNVSKRMCEGEVLRDMFKEVTEGFHHVGTCKP